MPARNRQPKWFHDVRASRLRPEALFLSTLSGTIVQFELVVEIS